MTDQPVHELIDASLGERVVVVGSLPPGGRDLDLLVSPSAQRVLTQTLSEAGFERLDGAKRRARLAQALREDGQAWDLARAHAPGWGAQQHLQRLRAFVAAPGTSLPGRPTGQSPWRERRAGLVLRPLIKHARRVLGRPRGSVIALSGLDGAGKSSQAQALCETLQRLGYDAVVEWTRIGCNDGFWNVAVGLKSRLNRIARISASPGKAPVDPVKAVRRGSGLLTHAWATAIALDDALQQRRHTRHHLRAGRIVICDRYVLDSIVSLRYMVDKRRRFAFQRRLFGRLSPRPLRAFLLEVSPETALQRRGEDRLPWLRGHFALYREEGPELGVRRLDGELERDELSALIAADVWRALAAGKG